MTAELTEQAAWLEALYRDHRAHLFRLGLVLLGDRQLAEDTVQEAFVRLHRSRSKPRVGAELAYLRRTVINLCHGHHRHVAVVRRAGSDPVADADSAEHEAGQRERQRAIVGAVRSLPDRQRDCVALHYWAELSDTEIGEVLGISAGSVKTHLHRGRAALASLMEAHR